MSLNTPLGSPAWFAEQEKAKQAGEVTQAKVREEAARNQPAPVPQSAKERAFSEAEKVYSQIMAEEAAKTAGDREAEGLATELETLTARMNEHYRHPSQYEAELKFDEARMAEIISRLQTLGAVPADGKEAPLTTGLHMEGGRIFDAYGRDVTRTGVGE